MIYSYSKFYYGHSVNAFTNKLTINGEIVELPFGKYSMNEFPLIVQNALNAVLDLTFLVSVNRLNRIMTISSTENFTLDVIGTGSSAFGTLGFLANRSGSDSYSGEVGSGKEYVPQYLLQNYMPFEDNKEYLYGKVNETATGKQEIISFGLVQRMECNIKYINNYNHAQGHPIIEDLSGLEHSREFMDYCIGKGNLEFIPNKEDPDTYYKCVLQSTQKSSTGVAYEIIENSQIAGYYETGNLTFRKI